MNRFSKRLLFEPESAQKIYHLLAEIENLKGQAEIEERKGDLQKVAELRYGRIPMLNKQLKNTESNLAKLLTKAVI